MQSERQQRDLGHGARQSGHGVSPKTQRIRRQLQGNDAKEHLIKAITIITREFPCLCAVNVEHRVGLDAVRQRQRRHHQTAQRPHASGTGGAHLLVGHVAVDEQADAGVGVGQHQSRSALHLCCLSTNSLFFVYFFPLPTASHLNHSLSLSLFILLFFLYSNSLLPSNCEPLVTTVTNVSVFSFLFYFK